MSVYVCVSLEVVYSYLQPVLAAVQFEIYCKCC